MGYSGRKPHGVRIRTVELSADDAYQYERLGSSLLSEALFEYDQFVSVDHRRMDMSRWKQWKHDDDVVVYRERHGSESLTDDTSGQTTSRLTAFSTANRVTQSTYEGAMRPRDAGSAKQPTPRLLAVGSLSTTLDDVLYGIVTPSAAAMRLKASYLNNNDFLDGAVIAQIRPPSPSDPFQFVGIKWVLQRGVLGSSLGLVRPRDFVFLESTGLQIRQDGSGLRVGYHIMHSVDLPECPGSVDGKGAVQRGAFSTCYLYHELPNGHGVDVYMTALVQPRGHLIAPIAMRSAAAMLRSNWRFLSLCAENKKLAWMLQTHRQLNAATASAAASAGVAKSRCGLCSKSLRGFGKKRVACQLCAMTVCSHCSMARTLKTEGFARNSVVATPMLFCKKCVALASEESASEIARQQIWEDEVVRTGRAHTQTAIALARRDTSGSRTMLLPYQYGGQTGFSTERSFMDTAPSAARTSMASMSSSMQPFRPRGNSRMPTTWHDTDPTQRYQIYDDSSTRGSLPTGKGGRRGTNATWGAASGRATETLSLGSLDYRNSLYPESNPAASERGDDASEAGRGSTASSALVLLDNRRSSRQMKAYDYLPHGGEPTSATATSTAAGSTTGTALDRMSFASSAMMTEGDIEVESVYSHASLTSSVAVMDLEPSQSRAELAHSSKPEPIAEESTSTSGFYDLYEHQKPPRPPQLPPQRHQSPSKKLPISYSFSEDQPRRSSRVHFQEQPQALEFSTSRGSEQSSQYRRSSLASSQVGSVSDRRLSYQMQLWLQMNELRDTAESTYQATKRNTEAMHHMRLFSQQPTTGRGHSKSTPMPMQLHRSNTQPEPRSAPSFVNAMANPTTLHRSYSNATTPAPLSH